MSKAREADSTMNTEIGSDIVKYDIDLKKSIIKVQEYHTDEDVKKINSYLNAVNSKMFGFIKKVKNLSDSNVASKLNEQIGTVNEREISDIKEKLNIDITGYKRNVNGSTINHIKKRHGENGLQDHSMANDEDIARLKYVLENYDDINVVKENDIDKETVAVARAWQNSDRTPSQIVIYTKKIDGTYYAAIAVPVSNAKKIQVISAYINEYKKIEAPELVNMDKSPHPTPKTFDPSASIEIISSDEKEGNTKFSLDYNSQGGYDGKRMSNRAVEAYGNGEMPLSKWNKTTLIEAIKEKADENDVEISSEELQKLTVKELQDNFLNNTSWHHTGAFYNKTNFYQLDEGTIDEIISNRAPRKKLTEEEIQAKRRNKDIIEESKEIYDKLDVIFNSGVTGLSTISGIENRWESGRLNLEEEYRQALNAIKEKDSSKVKQWEALPEGHWRKEDVELFRDNLTEYAKKHYLSRDARKKKVLEKIKKSVSASTDNPDINLSLSKPDENIPTDGYAVYGRDVKLQEEIAPIREDSTRPTRK